jgi:hypothetical protein
MLNKKFVENNVVLISYIISKMDKILEEAESEV